MPIDLAGEFVEVSVVNFVTFEEAFLDDAIGFVVPISEVFVFEFVEALGRDAVLFGIDFIGFWEVNFCPIDISHVTP